MTGEMPPVQTRANDGELRYFDTFHEADEYYRRVDPSIWKISYYDETGTRRRFVRHANAQGISGWKEEPLMDEVKRLLAEMGESPLD